MKIPISFTSVRTHLVKGGECDKYEGLQLLAVYFLSPIKYCRKFQIWWEIAQDQRCDVIMYDDIIMFTKSYIRATPVVRRYTKCLKSRV